jgi:hypothetical protein
MGASMKFAPLLLIAAIYHHANVRFTVGYTLPDNRVYAMVLKVL